MPDQQRATSALRDAIFALNPREKVRAMAARVNVVWFSVICLLSGIASETALAAQSRWYKVELMVFSQGGGSRAEQWPALPDLRYPERFSVLREAATSAVLDGQLDNGTSATTDVEEQPTQQSTDSLRTLADSQLRLRAQAEAMRSSGHYRVHFHKAWVQPMRSKRRALPIILDNSGETGRWPPLQGSVKLYLSRYLHLQTNLWLNTQGSYLEGDWHMPPPPLAPPSGDNNIASNAVTVYESGNPLRVPGALEDYPYRHAIALQQKRRMRSGELHYIDHPMMGALIEVTPLSD